MVTIIYELSVEVPITCKSEGACYDKLKAIITGIEGQGTNIEVEILDESEVETDESLD